MKKFCLFLFILIISSCNGTYLDRTLTLLKADRNFKNGQFEIAINQYTGIIDNSKEYHYQRYYCLSRRANAHYNLKNFSQALNDIESVVQIPNQFPNSNELISHSLTLEGRIYSIQDQKAKAIDSYKQALNFDKTTELYTNLGYCQIINGLYENAIDNLNSAIKLDSSNDYAYNNRGLAFIKLGKLEKAIKNIQIAEKLDSTNSFVYKHKALYHIAKDEFNLGCIQLSKAKRHGLNEVIDDRNSDEIDQLIQKYCF